MSQNHRGTRAIVAGLIVALLGACGATAAVALSRGAEPAPTRGTIPERAFLADGTLDPSLVPDLVSVEDEDGNVVGYARKEDIASPASAPSSVVQVWDADGKRLVGHVFPDGTGFLSVAETEKLVGVADGFDRLEGLAALAFFQLLDEPLATLLRATVELGAFLGTALQKCVELPRRAALCDCFWASPATGLLGRCALTSCHVADPCSRTFPV